MTSERAQRVVRALQYAGGTAQAEHSIESLHFDSLVYDSRRVAEGSAFFCVPGERTDGNEFIRDAITGGATCIISERAHANLSIPQMVVPDVRLALALAADAFYENPSSKLRLIGVTGTNGKTTTTHLIEYILNRGGKSCGLIGTLGARWASEAEYGEAKHTTPQAPELQQLLARMLGDGCKYVSMEVSSHSLSLKRVAGCHFAAAVLTNITQDHLDFHKTMDHYWRSKRTLFESVANEADESSLLCVNLDDPLASEFLAAGKNSSVRKLTYGYSSKADVHVLHDHFARGVNHVELHTPAGKLDLRLKLAGRFNVYNVMAAVAVTLHEGIAPDIMIEQLQKFAGVPGRFETVSTGAAEEPLCIVDYAHTPDGLENVLKTAAGLKRPNSKLIAVFGCGGDRDPSKRPKMGEIAERLADKVIVTSDNPRTEDPQEIIANILTGIKRMRHIEVEPDRAAAIAIAIGCATENDIVVVAGKGHENYQLVMNQVFPFDDKVEVLKALRHQG